MLGNPPFHCAKYPDDWLFSLGIFFLVSNQNLPSSNLYPLPLIFSSWFPNKRESPSSFCIFFLHLPSYTFFVATHFNTETPLSLLFSRLNFPVPSAFPDIGFPVLWSPLWLFPGPSLAHPCLFCILGTKTEHNIPGVAWQVLSGVRTSLSCRWCSSLHTGIPRGLLPTGQIPGWKV